MPEPPIPPTAGATDPAGAVEPATRTELAEPADGADAVASAPSRDGAPLSNDDLAAVFHEIGDLLEIRGELVFKTVAYHRAADAIGHCPVEITAAYRGGRPPEIPGVGKAISNKLAELAATGRLRFLDRLRSEVPAGLVELLAIPGVGPKTVRALWQELAIESLDGLRAALASGALARIRGLSAKSIEGIRAGIDGLDRRSTRMTLGQAERIVESIRALLVDVPGVRSIVPAGSFRRRRETIGDLDLLAETDRPKDLVERFVTLAEVEVVLNAGPRKAAVRLRGGPQVDLMVMPPGAAGTYLVHFTGSKEHNVRLRALARDRGWSLSEKGFVQLGEDGEPVPGAAARAFSSEEEAYAFLDLAWVPPELREDRGEIEAAAGGRLPRLIAGEDLQGDCHAHSDWSDGIHTIEQMAEAARARGYAYLVLSDHTFGLAIARGLTPERVRRQRAVVDALNARFAREEDAGSAPPSTPPEGFRLLHGCELEIRADGALDFDEDVLAAFDVVLASLHQGRRQPREQLTRRVLTAIRSPHVDVIGHPAGRMLGERERPDLDLAWDELYAAAAATGTLLEIDGSDHRLDLAPERARLAVELGCRLTIDSDAHRIEELDGIRWGVAQARRAWVEPPVVANTWPRAELLAWVAGKPGRVG